MVLDKLSLQNDIDRYRSELTRKDDSERSLERRAMEKSDEVQQLQQRNEDMSAELRRQRLAAQTVLISVHIYT